MFKIREKKAVKSCQIKWINPPGASLNFIKHFIKNIINTQISNIQFFTELCSDINMCLVKL